MDKAADALIVTTQKDAVLQVQLNRARKKNALTRQMYASLADTLEQAAQASETKVVLITGSEDSFTSGNDINDFLAQPPHDPNSPVLRFLKANRNGTSMWIIWRRRICSILKRPTQISSPLTKKPPFCIIKINGKTMARTRVSF